MTVPRSLPPLDDEETVFDYHDEAQEAAADARAEADVAAGRTISNDAVMRWLMSKWTDNPLPRPKWGE